MRSGSVTPVGSAIGRRGARTGEAVAAIGGAVMLAGSWAVVTATDDIPAVEDRVFAAVNGLPDPLWPVVWVPVQVGSFVGSLLVVGATAGVTRRPRLTASACLPARARTGAPRP